MAERIGLAEGLPLDVRSSCPNQPGKTLELRANVCKTALA
jgi:hypothetical protein